MAGLDPAIHVFTASPRLSVIALPSLPSVPSRLRPIAGGRGFSGFGSVSASFDSVLSSFDSVSVSFDSVLFSFDPVSVSLTPVLSGLLWILVLPVQAGSSCPRSMSHRPITVMPRWRGIHDLGHERRGCHGFSRGMTMEAGRRLRIPSAYLRMPFVLFTMSNSGSPGSGDENI
jgi:hypothetical protein